MKPFERLFKINTSERKEPHIESTRFLPEYLRKVFPWRDEPESEQLPLAESAFAENKEIKPEFAHLLKLKKAITAENERRKNAGLQPVTFLGIHASTNEDKASQLLVHRLLDVTERLGVKTDFIALSDEEGALDQAHIQETINKIRESDGFVITTHTRRGVLNSYMATLLEALEKENLSGKLVSFSHTFSDEDKDSQIGPPQLIERFFTEKGCVILPYSLMYVHEGEANEKWLERDIERNGVNFVKAVERLSTSELPNFLMNPDILKKRKVEGKISPEWEKLKSKVESINEARRNKQEKPLNVLFVFGGENPKGYSTRTAKVLAKNFEYLGLATNIMHLAAEKKGAETTDTIQEPEASDAHIIEMYKKILDADIIIFSTPVFWFEASSRLQKFIEQTTPLEVSGFLLEGKAFGTVITFSEAGATDVESRLKTFAQHNGMMNIPLGGLKVRLGSSSQEKANIRNADFLNESRYENISQMAAMGTVLLTEFLATDGKDVKKFRLDHLNSLLSILSPED